MPKLSIEAVTSNTQALFACPPSVVVCCPGHRAQLEWSAAMIAKGDFAKLGTLIFYSWEGYHRPGLFPGIRDS